MNTDNNYNPIDLSKKYLQQATLDNQVSIEEGFNVELYEVSSNLAFIKNFGNIAVFKNNSSGLLIDTGMGVSSIQVVEKCGYPLNLSGEKGVMEFKNYYLSKDEES